MHSRVAASLAFFSSAAILVVEIAAGRLMAPYVGVSLETFTAIIGVILAGIAVGAAVGGALADRLEARRLIGPALVVGGALVWLAVPITRAFGPGVGDSPTAIVVLTTLGFFAPAVALAAVTPIVAKMRLDDLGDTGSVFGGLSAAGTAGGLAGTFLTGFVLVTAVGTRTILFSVGILAVVVGVVVHVWLTRSRPTVASAAIVLAAGLSVFGFPEECDVETKYSCAEIRVDASDESVISLYLDASHHARVDIDDPTNIEFRYIRLFVDVVEALGPGPVDALHIGGGGFTLPLYIEETRPASTNHVLEIDPGVVDIAVDVLGVTLDDRMTVDVGDARTALDDLATEGYDLVVGDAFTGKSVPWHLTTVEVAEEIDRLLTPDGLYVMNVIDSRPNDFARAEIATLQAVFDHVAVVLPDDRAPGRARNQILVASNAPIPDLGIAEADGVVLSDEAVAVYVDGAAVLTDDFAPVDQIVNN